MSLVELFHIHRSRVWLLARYGVSGVFGATISIVCLYVWVDLLGLEEHYLWGAVVGFCISLVVTFALQKYWTFQDKTHHRVHKQFGMYFIVALINVALNIGLLALSKTIVEASGRDFFHGWYLAAQILIVVFVSAVSFVLNYFFTFKKVPTL